MNKNEKSWSEAPQGLKEILQSMFTYDNPSDETRMVLGSIEDLTVQRKEEIEEVARGEFERAINRGRLHRFTGFLDNEP